MSDDCGGNPRLTHHDFAAIIARISASETNYPGAVVGPVTVAMRCGLGIGNHLSDGDGMALTIEGIGTLWNTIRHRLKVGDGFVDA